LKFSFAKHIFGKRYGMLERKRKTVMSRPLTPKEINMLLSIMKNNVPLYESIDVFYSEEFKASMGKPAHEHESKTEHYRPATEQEANLLYCDVHSREVND